MQALSKLQTEDGEIYLAGQRVPPGIYRQIGNRRIVRLEREDRLPASLDGRVACYERMVSTWAQRPQNVEPGRHSRQD